MIMAEPLVLTITASPATATKAGELVEWLGSGAGPADCLPATRVIETRRMVIDVFRGAAASVLALLPVV